MREFLHDFDQYLDSPNLKKIAKTVALRPSTLAIILHLAFTASIFYNIYSDFTIRILALYPLSNFLKAYSTNNVFELKKWGIGLLFWIFVEWISLWNPLKLGLILAFYGQLDDILSIIDPQIRFWYSGRTIFTK